MSFDIREKVPASIKFSDELEFASELFGIYEGTESLFLSSDNGQNTVKIQIKDIPNLVKSLQFVEKVLSIDDGEIE